MERNVLPCLIVDIGGTLMKRTRPGALHRALGWLRDVGVRLADADGRLALARAVFTSRDAAEAASEVVARFDVPPAHEASLRDLLLEPDGEALIFDGAETLLATARGRGWRIVGATNAVRWIAPVPDSIARYCDSIVSSSELDLIKQEPDFWRRLARKCTIDPRFGVVVGDDRDADIRPAHAAGFAAIQIDHRTVTINGLRAALDESGPVPVGCTGIAAGIPYAWRGKCVVDVQNLVPLVTDVTRARVFLQAAGTARAATIVRRRDRCPVLLYSDATVAPFLLGWVRTLPDRRVSICPRDLADALAAAEISLVSLSDRQKRHLISMVREAREPGIRTQRIAGVIEYLKSLSEHL